MENRFGVKDFFLFVLLIVVIVMLFLAMKQFDRQWEIVRSINANVSQQTAELSQLRRAIEQGGRAIASTQPSVSDGREPFPYVKKARQNPDYAIGGVLVDMFPVRVARLTPLGLSGDLYSRIVQNRIQESLGYVDPYTLEYIPLLATDWKVTDNSQAWKSAFDALVKKIAADPAAAAKEPNLPKDLAEAMQKFAKGEIRDVPHDLLVGHPALPSAIDVAFELRRGVTFSDGAPFTADDVVFTVEYIMNPQVAAPRERAYYSKFKSVEKTGEYSVVFRYKEPYYEAFSLAADLQILPKHFYTKFTIEQFNTMPGLVMGTGPYRLKTPDGWKPGELIELHRNERYWGEPAPYDRIVYHEIESDEASLTRFENGELDIFPATPDQYEALLAKPNVRQRAQNFEYSAPQAGYSYIAWNQKKAGKPTPFADKRVRQAMTMLTDRQRVIDEIWLGHGKVATGPFSPLLQQCDPNIKPWPYDPARARELLREAGYADRNGDGLIEGPDGQPLRFTFTYGSKSPLIERMALLLKDGYAKAGIIMNPDPADWPIMLKKIDSRDFDAITLAWGGSLESDAYQIFHSSQIGDNGDNYIGYVNRDLDRVLERARSTVDKSARMPIWQEAHRILHEDQPYTFMISRVSLSFIDRKVRNIESSKLGLNYSQLFVMPIPWYIPANLQRSR